MLQATPLEEIRKRIAQLKKAQQEPQTRHLGDQAAVGVDDLLISSTGFEQTTGPDLMEELEINEDTLEQSEADLITHIRTSGMKKTRENQLVEGLMKLRRDRRKAMAHIKRQVAQSEEDCEMLRKRIEQCISDCESTLTRERREMRQLLDSTQKQMENIAGTFEKNTQARVADVRAAYEVKLHILEQKLVEINSRHEAQAAEKTEMQALLQSKVHECENKVKSVCDQQEAQYVHQLNKYRTVIENMRKREAISQETSREQIDRMATLECSLLEAQQENNRLDEVVCSMRSKVQELEGEKTKLQRVLEDLQARSLLEVKSLHEQINMKSSTMLEEVVALKRQHHDELEKIDEKVRKALSAKDGVIASLHLQCKNADRRANEAESLLQELEQGLNSQD